MHKTDVAALEAALVLERRHLRSGNLAALSALADQKHEFERGARISPKDLPALKGVLAMAQENQRLIAAALAGVQAAQARLRSVTKAASGMTSYTAQGRALRLDQAVSKVERRT
jgi:hypothetical protein